MRWLCPAGSTLCRAGHGADERGVEGGSRCTEKAILLGSQGLEMLENRGRH